MNELAAKVSEPTALQNPTPTELALLKRLEDCAVVMRGMADMMRTTNERMGALEREVRMLTKVTPAQATAILTPPSGSGRRRCAFPIGRSAARSRLPLPSARPSGRRWARKPCESCRGASMRL